MANPGKLKLIVPANPHPGAAVVWSSLVNWLKAKLRLPSISIEGYDPDFQGEDLLSFKKLPELGKPLTLYRHASGIAVVPGTIGGHYPVIGSTAINEGPPFPTVTDGGASSEYCMRFTVSITSGACQFDSILFQAGGGTTMTPMVIDDDTGDSSSPGIYYFPWGGIDAAGAIYSNYDRSLGATFCRPDLLNLL